MPKQTPRHHTSWKGKGKKRCQEENCNKRAKDFHDGKWLCRIHSPMREGFKTLHGLDKKGKRKKE